MGLFLNELDFAFAGDNKRDVSTLIQKLWIFIEKNKHKNSNCFVDMKKTVDDLISKYHEFDNNQMKPKYQLLNKPG